jgi:Zn-dependent protease with chaperone function
MLTKPLIFLLTFLLSIVNFIILLVPVAIVGFPLFIFLQTLFVKIGANMLFFLVSRISFLMLVYLALDFIFGLTVRRMNKGNIKFDDAKAIMGHEDIVSSFYWLRKKFNMPNVELYISPTYDEVNAYAVGSLRRKSITITMGLIEKIKSNSQNTFQYIDAIKGVLGHEMSHLANGDYLPGLLASANDSANRKVSALIRFIFIIFANFFRIIPYIGKYIYRFIITIYNFINNTINFFYNYGFMPLYNFMKKWLGRSIEYRCDKESAKAFGGSRMVSALSMLGAGSYFSIFSTHPRTKSRIKYIENVKPVSGKVNTGIINDLANFISVVLVIFICAYSTQKTDVPGMYEHYMTEVYYPLQTKALNLKYQALELYSKFSK